MKVFIFDAARCNGCHNCQIACKDEHVGNEWLPYAKEQPNTGQFWMRVKQTEHGQMPYVNVEYRTWMCQHCEDPACMKAAPEAVYKRDDGLVIIDPLKAEGHREIVDACPYNVVFYNEELNIPQKCTGCAHLVDEGKVPHCVDLCATEALRFGDEEDFADEIARAELMMPETGCRPRMYYLNLPHLFIAGEVWDPEANEDIIGATVTLTCPDGSKITQQTDDIGDFWFKGLDEGTYSIAIEADGFKPRNLENIELTKSLNVGDFPLEAA